jgi:hypothetical protein
MFSAPVVSNDGDGRVRGYDDRGRDSDDWDGVRIVRAYYGVQGRQANVTDLLRSLARGSALEVNVNNRSMGGDPAPGADKVLIVIYRYHGTEAATAVREGNTLSIP